MFNGTRTRFNFAAIGATMNTLKDAADNPEPVKKPGITSDAPDPPWAEYKIDDEEKRKRIRKPKPKSRRRIENNGKRRRRGVQNRIPGRFYMRAGNEIVMVDRKGAQIIFRLNDATGCSLWRAIANLRALSKMMLALLYRQKLEQWLQDVST